MNMELHYDKRLEQYLHYMKKAIGNRKKLVFKRNKGYELKHLDKYIKYGICKTDFGIFFRYNAKKNKLHTNKKSITELEWDINEIKLYEKDFKSKKHFYRTSFLFLNLAIKEFLKSEITDKILFKLSFFDLDFVDTHSPFYTDDFINQLDFRMYGIRQDDEIFNYKNFIDEKNPISATLCVIVENSNYKLGEQNENNKFSS